MSKATNDISSTSSNGQIIDTAGDTAGEYSQVATAKSTGTTFTYNDGTSSSSTTIKGNAISTGSIDATGNISAASVDEAINSLPALQGDQFYQRRPQRQCRRCRQCGQPEQPWQPERGWQCSGQRYLDFPVYHQR